MTEAATQLADPRPFHCLHDAIGDVLSALGDDVDQVLDVLDAAGVPGWPGHPHMDPLCRWLAAALPDIGVKLEGTRLRVWAGSADVALVAIPEPVLAAQRKIAAGAAGEAPRLCLDTAPPPLPGPHYEDIYPREYLDQLYPPVTVRVVDPVDGPDRRAATTEIPRAAWAGVPPSPTLDPPKPRPARQDDTVTLPPISAAAGDRGSVLVRFAAVCGVGAVAAFLLAAGGPAQLAGAVVALAWPVGAVLTLRRRDRYAGRHYGGGAHRPEVVAR